MQKLAMDDIRKNKNKEYLELIISVEKKNINILKSFFDVFFSIGILYISYLFFEVAASKITEYFLIKLVFMIFLAFFCVFLSLLFLIKAYSFTRRKSDQIIILKPGKILIDTGFSNPFPIWKIERPSQLLGAIIYILNHLYPKKYELVSNSVEYLTVESFYGRKSLAFRQNNKRIEIGNNLSDRKKLELMNIIKNYYS